MNVLTRTEEAQLLKKIHDEERIEKEVAISWDKNNLLVRIPKDIAAYLGVSVDNRFEKLLKFVIVEKDGVVKKEFDIIDKNGKEKTEE